jgi:hypothetical protein
LGEVHMVLCHPEMGISSQQKIQTQQRTMNTLW